MQCTRPDTVRLKSSAIKADICINQIVCEGMQNRNWTAGRFLLNDLLPTRFRNLGAVSSPLSSPPPHPTVTALQSPLPCENLTAGARKTFLLSFQLSVTKKQYPFPTCTVIRNDTAATDIGCYRLKASGKLRLYGTCQSLFLDFISITYSERFEGTLDTPIPRVYFSIFLTE